eukprot:5716936-Pleurochrysis_carterae.AAC.1
MSTRFVQRVYVIEGRACRQWSKQAQLPGKRSSQSCQEYSGCLCGILIAQMTKHEQLHKIAVLDTIRLEVETCG